MSAVLLVWGKLGYLLKAEVKRMNSYLVFNIFLLGIINISHPTLNFNSTSYSLLLLSLSLLTLCSPHSLTLTPLSGKTLHQQTMDVTLCQHDNKSNVHPTICYFKNISQMHFYNLISQK